jgi:hypothetical protein
MFNKSDDLLSDALILSPLSGTSITMWSEDKRKDFVAVFQARTDVARYILYKTAFIILETASKRYFISPPKFEALRQKLQSVMPSGGNWRHGCGGRSHEELDIIAQERAADVIDGLPSVIQTFSLLQPDVAKQMVERDKCSAELKVLGEKFAELPTDISMKAMDPEMTIGAFLKHIDDVRQTRDSLVTKMNRVAEKGNELSRIVDKALYSGVPELAKAVTDIVATHCDKILAFGATTRRIEERVLFGDNQAALDILKTFEEDERVVGVEVKTQFQSALDALGLSKAARRKSATKKKAKK